MTSSCICPDKLDQLVMIEYPGFVKNPERALHTLGGIESVSNVYNSSKDRLELKFRKSDPLAHPAYGDRFAKKCLVLNLKKISKDGDEDQFEISIVGKIQTSFKFETLAEFQWLPMQRTNIIEVIDRKHVNQEISVTRSSESLNPTYASILDEALPLKNPFDSSIKNFNTDAPLLILPAVFSRFDTSREIHHPHPKFRSQEMREEFIRQEQMSIIGRTRKKRSTMSYLLNFSDKVPERAPEKLIKERSNLSRQEENLLPRLEECFSQQGVWSKAALCYELKCSAMDIKYILPLVAFHYLNGPFRTMWVRYGYNPHIDTSSKLLQTLDFRVKPQDQQEYSKRSLHQYQLPMKKNAEKQNKNQIDLKLMISRASYDFRDLPEDPMSSSKSQPITEAMCKFRRDLVPSARQLSYQLKDIEIEEVQEIIHSNDNREPAQCQEKDGWLPEGSIERIRKIMVKSLNDTMEQVTNQLEEV